MPKLKHAVNSLFDSTRFGELMHSVESTHDVDQDECAKCGEHMLDCECEEETA